MVHALVQFEVEEFDRFWENYRLRGYPLRQAHGSKGSLVFHDAARPRHVTVLFEWESREHLEGFLDDPRVKEAIEKGGVKGEPRITYLQKVGEMDA